MCRPLESSFSLDNIDFMVTLKAKVWIINKNASNIMITNLTWNTLSSQMKLNIGSHLFWNFNQNDLRPQVLTCGVHIFSHKVYVHVTSSEGVPCFHDLSAPVAMVCSQPLFFQCAYTCPHLNMLCPHLRILCPPQWRGHISFP